MPKLPEPVELPILSFDTEGTGLDHYHGAKPYFVSMCEEDGTQYWWEWDVNPLNRQPIVPEGDVAEIKSKMQGRRIALQNGKHDVQAMARLPGWGDDWPYERTYDTLLASHLISSNLPKDLTTRATIHLGVNIEQFEKVLQKYTLQARGIAKKHFPKWRRARKGLSDMPSAKGKDKKSEGRGGEKSGLWKFDAWLNRAIVKEVIHTLKFDIIPDDPRMPTVVRKVDGCDVLIGRESKWGNPFVIGKDGTREDVVKKYAAYIWKSPLVNDLPELYGKRIGCAGNCKPELCHGDILRVLCHPFMTVLRDYGNADTAVTNPLLVKQLQIIEARRLMPLYRERLKIIPITVEMEREGVTLNENKVGELEVKFTEQSKNAARICRNIAQTYGYDLKLPAGGTNKSLHEFAFDVLKLEVVERTEKEKKPSIKKRALDHYRATLPEKSKPGVFVKNLALKRKADTALSYLEGYKRFWLPWIPVDVDPVTGAGWYVLHPFLNPTGSDTLRWSSSNPNSQNISKQEGFNLRAAFGPAPGREWWSMDAKNIELRLPAYEAEETEMIQLFERPKDPPYFGSYHLLIFDTLHPDKFAKHGPAVKDVFESTWYQWTKNGNFAVQYGAIEKDIDSTADKAYHVPGAQKRIKSRFQKIAKLNDYYIAYAEKHGYVETMQDLSVEGTDRGYPLLCTRTEHGRILPTVPLNYHIQGSAMWWMQKAMVRCHAVLQSRNRRDPRGYRIAMQVHDELVFDFPAGTGSKPWQTNLPLAIELQGEMARGGDDFGLPTPVSRKYHPVSWDQGIAV